MPTSKATKASAPAKSTKRFSLVPSAAQYEMYRALATLKSSRTRSATASEVTEVAVCLAAGEPNPVILACSARGARAVRTDSKLIGLKASKGSNAKDRRLAAATLAAVEALLAEPEACAAVICAGKLDSTPEAQQDYRNAFRFAARYKLPILYIIANSAIPGQGHPQDLRTLYPEFGIPLFSVDADDAIAAYRVATEALHNARYLRGPCVIEALAIPHGTSEAISPIELLAHYMERHGNPPQSPLD